MNISTYVLLKLLLSPLNFRLLTFDFRLSTFNFVTMTFIKKHLFLIIFSAAGALGGFLYWKLIGCTSGTCPIKSVWYLSTLWGLAFGYLGGSIIKDLIDKFNQKKRSKQESSSEGI